MVIRRRDTFGTSSCGVEEFEDGVLQLLRVCLIVRPRDISGSGVCCELALEVSPLGTVKKAILVDVGGSKGSCELGHSFGLALFRSVGHKLGANLGLILLTEGGSPGISLLANHGKCVHRVLLVNQRGNVLGFGFVALVCRRLWLQ